MLSVSLSDQFSFPNRPERKPKPHQIYLKEDEMLSSRPGHNKQCPHSQQWNNWSDYPQKIPRFAHNLWIERSTQHEHVHKYGLFVCLFVFSRFIIIIVIIIIIIIFIIIIQIRA